MDFLFISRIVPSLPHTVTANPTSSKKSFFIISNFVVKINKRGDDDKKPYE